MSDDDLLLLADVSIRALAYTDVPFGARVPCPLSFHVGSAPDCRRRPDSVGSSHGRFRHIHELASGTIHFFPYFFLKRSMRPPVSRTRCFPVKNGCDADDISTLISG